MCGFEGGDEGFLEAVGGVGLVVEEAEGGLPDDGAVAGDDVPGIEHYGDLGEGW